MENLILGNVKDEANRTIDTLNRVLISGQFTNPEDVGKIKAKILELIDKI